MTRGRPSKRLGKKEAEKGEEEPRQDVMEHPPPRPGMNILAQLSKDTRESPEAAQQTRLDVFPSYIQVSFPPPSPAPPSDNFSWPPVDRPARPGEEKACQAQHTPRQAGSKQWPLPSATRPPFSSSHGVRRVSKRVNRPPTRGGEGQRSHGPGSVVRLVLGERARIHFPLLPLWPRAAPPPPPVDDVESTLASVASRAFVDRRDFVLLLGQGPARCMTGELPTIPSSLPGPPHSVYLYHLHDEKIAQFGKTSKTQIFPTINYLIRVPPLERPYRVWNGRHTNSGRAYDF
ncbi:hypothetical protein LY78DRAFT_296508 [Colletotrichum sublineola]|nr:hypothetical protein LY78DRAFT_296508 [Colletotrichum sublineola]